MTDLNSEPERVVIGGWSPPNWGCGCVPLPSPDTEVITMTYLVSALTGEAAQCTEADTTPLGRVLHVAHILVNLQGADGLWPAVLNVKTRREIGNERDAGPLALLRHLNRVLNSTEFDLACRRAEAGVLARQSECNSHS